MFQSTSRKSGFRETKRQEKLAEETGMPLSFQRSSVAALAASPVAFLATMTFVNWLGYAGWSALLNNFAKEAAGFTGRDVGLMQTVREIPGFLSFTAIFFFLVLREQTFGYASLAILSFGVAITGLYPSLAGLLCTTFIMSVGFHYYETVNQSLSLQLLPKAQAPRLMGKIAGFAAAAQLLAFGAVGLAWWLWQPPYHVLFMGVGASALAILVAASRFFDRFQGATVQHKGFVLRKRYWLYYALTFMSGARRQIFMAFGGFLLVERFGYSVVGTAGLLMIACILNTVLAPRMGALVGRIGERATITLENASLVLVFLGYAVASEGHFGAWGGAAAGMLFILDAIFFTLIIAQRTYFQKIGDPADMAPTAAVAFTINHIAAVVIPVTFGLIWMWSPAAVFLIGAVIATISLSLSFLVPRHPEPGFETVLKGRPAIAPAE